MHYRFLNHINEPKRFLTLTLDETCIAGLSMLLLVVSSHKVSVALFGFGLLTALRGLKRGEKPNVLLVLAYWYFPHAITRFFLPHLPASHHRVWTA